MFKRLAVWFAEIVCEVPLLMLLLVALFGSGEPENALALRSLLFATLVFVLGSGYVITTLVAAVYFRGWMRGRYPLVAGLLFVVQEQAFLSGWVLPTREHLFVQASGASIVFCTTFVGERCLQTWSGKQV